MVTKGSQMRNSRNNHQEPQPRIVEKDERNPEPLWWIERQPGKPDYWSYVDGLGFIGARATQTAARMLIAEFNVPEAS